MQIRPAASLAFYQRLPASGRAALLILAVHTILLFFPPIPPDIRGSLWSHLLAYSFLLAAAVACNGKFSELLHGWSQLTVGRRLATICTCAVAAALVGALAYSAVPQLFVRLSSEEGLWEPLSTACYLLAAILLYKVARQHDDRMRRRHLLFMAALYAFLFLEEINYLEIFGGLMPRVEGLYLGAAHDIINLWSQNALSPAVLSLSLAFAFVLGAVFWWLDFLQPAAIWRSLTFPRWTFFVAGCVLIAAALGIEARLIYWRGDVQRPEELFELTGAIFLFAFALDLAAHHHRSGPSAVN